MEEIDKMDERIILKEKLISIGMDEGDALSIAVESGSSQGIVN